MAGFSSKGHRRTQRRVNPAPAANARQAAFLNQSGRCAIETLLVVFAPCGYPVMNRLIYCGKADVESIRHAKAEKEASLRKLENDYSAVLQQLEGEKIRGERLKKMMMEYQSKGQSLMVRPIDELSIEEMQTLIPMIEELKEKVRKSLRGHFPDHAASALAEENYAFFGGSSEGDSSAGSYVP